MSMEVRMDSGIETAIDDCASPTAYKEENHQSGQCSGNHALTDHAADGAAYEDRLVRQGGDLHLRGQNQCSAGKYLFDSRDDIQSRCCSSFEDSDQHTAVAILAHHVGLHGEPVT